MRNFESWPTRGSAARAPERSATGHVAFGLGRVILTLGRAQIKDEPRLVHWHHSDERFSPLRICRPCGTNLNSTVLSCSSRIRKPARLDSESSEAASFGRRSLRIKLNPNRNQNDAVRPSAGARVGRGRLFGRLLSLKERVS